jgi:DNA-binding transcriptional LysR family regulator
MIPTPTEIKYFIEVYQTKHITRAALRLGVTQPTLTQAIKSIELKVEAPLFYRTKQGVHPTKAALQFYANVKNLNDCWDDIKMDVAKSTSELEGDFTIGCHQSVASYVAPPLLRKIDVECPNISIRFIHDFSRKITEKIVAYDVDIGFVVNPFKHPDLVYKKIGDDKVTFWKKVGISKIPKRIFADGQREQVEHLLGSAYKNHFKDWKIVDSTSLEVVRTMVAEGLGVGVIPERVAMADQYGLEIYNKNLPVRPDEIFLAYRKEVMSSKAAKELVALSSLRL